MQRCNFLSCTGVEVGDGGIPTISTCGAALDVDNAAACLMADGLVRCPKAVDVRCPARLMAGIRQAGLTAGRGAPYVDFYPEILDDFVLILTHPWLRALATGGLGPDYCLLAIGVARTPLDRWCRAAVSPPETRCEKRLIGLVFDFCGMNGRGGRLAFMPGSHWLPGDPFAGRMRVPERWMDARAGRIRTLTLRPGDLVVRSPLTVCGGGETGARSETSCLRLVLGAPGGKASGC